MVNEIYGKKLGMTQIFTEEGIAIPVTVIEITPVTVVAKKTTEKEGYNAIVVSFGDIKEKNSTKPMKGIFEKANTKVQRHLREIKVENTDEFEIGSVIEIDVLNDVKTIDVSASSKGKGFQGVIKRHNQHRGPMTHGSMYHRRPGSMGATSTPGRVFKGKKLPGHMGNRASTILNLDVVKVDKEKSVILVKGSVPGSKQALVKVRKSVK